MNPKFKKGLTIATLISVIVFVIFIYFKFYFVFGEGVKTGQLNNLVRNGYLFKTYEGKMIQINIHTVPSDSVKTMEFPFSVEDKVVADSLMRCSGKEVELHYKEYLGILPWRGVNKIIVDKIVSVK